MIDVARAVEAIFNGHSHLSVIEPGEALPAIGVPVYDGQPDERPRIYVSYWLTSPLPQTRRASGDSPLGLYALTTMCAGKTPNEVRMAAQAVHEALTLARPAVAGRVSGPITLGTAGQVRTDTNVSPPATVLTDVWRFRISN